MSVKYNVISFSNHEMSQILGIPYSGKFWCGAKLCVHHGHDFWCNNNKTDISYLKTSRLSFYTNYSTEGCVEQQVSLS